VIYVGIDDTDTKTTPGTNQLVRWLVGRLPPGVECLLAVRHQLLFDPRIPYTSKNSSASILLRTDGTRAIEDLAGHLRRQIMERFVEGSDPGLCVTEHVPADVTAFAERCQRDVVTQDEARRLAARHPIHLEGIGGTEDGVIGALAAVGLAAGGNDGRVVQIGSWPDDLSGPQEVGLLRSRGVAEIRPVGSGGPVVRGTVDVGKHLRPNYRGGRVVLFVARPGEEAASSEADWLAVRFP
jgi:hypothetical protein